MHSFNRFGRSRHWRRRLGLVFCSLLACGWPGCTGDAWVPTEAVVIEVSSEQLMQEAESVLDAALVSPDPAVRCHALETIVLLPGLDVPAKVRRGMSDASPAVRFAAAVVAGDLKDYAAKARLEQLARDEHASVKLAAGYALERMGDPRFARWYDYVLMGHDEALCAQACLLLGKLGETPQRKDSRSRLWAVLKREDVGPSVRLEAAEALARLGDESVLKRLVVSAGSPYADDRLRSIEGLKLIGGTDALAMISVLAEDPQIEVKLSALGALGDHADKVDRAFVRDALDYRDPQGDPTATARVRGLALLALGSVGEPEDARRLLQAMKSDEAYLRVVAARAAIDFVANQRRRSGVQGM